MRSPLIQSGQTTIDVQVLRSRQSLRAEQIHARDVHAFKFRRL
jgi:hypothetical protein